jgi:flagellar basal-body rod protein FlgF
MSKEMFTAVSGAMAQAAKLDTVANNLANVNTAGFKRDAQVFKEYMNAQQNPPTPIEKPRISSTIDSFYPLGGADKSFVEVAGTYTDFTQGVLRPTGNPLDLAIEGDAFFEVVTPEGPRYARAGNFSIDGDGRLITKNGYPVQREGGGEIRVTSPDVVVSSAGEVFDKGQSVGRLSLTKFANKDALRKQGHSLYSLNPAVAANAAPAADVKLHQGYIEGSNVNVVREMTDMIQATRVFESTQKAIQAYDQMSNKVVNEIPKL